MYCVCLCVWRREYLDRAAVVVKRWLAPGRVAHTTLVRDQGILTRVEWGWVGCGGGSGCVVGEEGGGVVTLAGVDTIGGQDGEPERE